MTYILIKLDKLLVVIYIKLDKLLVVIYPVLLIYKSFFLEIYKIIILILYYILYIHSIKLLNYV